MTTMAWHHPGVVTSSFSASTFDAPGSSGSHASCLSRTLEGAVILPNLSPLTARTTLKPTIAIEHVGSGLCSNGFDVGWSDGTLQVSTPEGRPPLSFFDGSLFTASPKNSYRGRTSSLSFQPYKGRDSFLDGNNRPQTSTSAEHLGRPRGGRFSSLNGTSNAERRLASAGGSPTRARSGSSGGPHEGAFDTSLRHSSLYPAELLSPRHPPIARQRGFMPPSDALHAPGEPLTWRPSSQPGPSSVEAAPMDSEMASSSHLTGSSSPLQPGRVPTRQLHLERPGTSSTPTSQPGSPSSRPGTSNLTNTQRARAQHPMAAYRPSRGHALIVFNDMDRDKNGKLTKAEFEDAAVKLGFSLEQAVKLFAKLDKSGRGFLDAQDWGNRDWGKLIESFTLMYMQRFMGLPDVTSTPEQVAKYFRREKLREVKSLPAAVNLVRVNAITRGSHLSSGSGNAVFDSFSFIDTNGSGDLSKEELRDAFFAMGVFLSEPVIAQIMSVFDHNGDGIVNYHEFVRTMFPATSKSTR